MDRCPCGRPLHYSDPELQATVDRIIALVGDPDLTVQVGDRAWRVPRHYIALHGLKAADLPSLGFPEVVKE